VAKHNLLKEMTEKLAASYTDVLSGEISFGNQHADMVDINSIND
jgi:hypothetical protein